MPRNNKDQAIALMMDETLRGLIEGIIQNTKYRQRKGVAARRWRDVVLAMSEARGHLREHLMNAEDLQNSGQR